MKHLLAAVFVLLSWPVLAQDILPALFDVTDVAADDVLNVRAAPSASADLVGTFAASETGIEVIALSEDGAWGRVNTGEQAGWTSMRYLARQPGQSPADWSVGLAPMTLDCFGTEPFWRVALVPGERLTFSALNRGGAEEAGGYTAITASASTGKRGFFGWLDAEPLGFTGIISTELCGDGMSDRDYGFAIDLILSDTEGDSLAAGCCRLVR